MRIKQDFVDDTVHIYVPLHVYPYGVLFSFNATDKELEEIMINKYDFSPEDLENKHHTYEGGSAKWAIYPNGLNIGLVRMKKIPESTTDFAILHHEIFHIVAAILQQVGMVLQVGISDEAYAYLISFLTEEVYNNINEFY